MDLCQQNDQQHCNIILSNTLAAMRKTMLIHPQAAQSISIIGRIILSI